MGPCPPPPSPVKMSHKKMAAKGDHIDFMFRALPPPPGRPLDPLLIRSQVSARFYIYQSFSSVHLWCASTK